MRGSKKDGRRSAMASEGLYMAAMIALVNGVARARYARRKMRRWSGCSVQRAMMRAKAEAAAGRIHQCGGADLVLSFGWPTH
jgi:hypothetical protein